MIIDIFLTVIDDIHDIWIASIVSSRFVSFLAIVFSLLVLVFI